MNVRRPTPGQIEPELGQESVWDYPRPPRLEPVKARLRVVLGGATIAETVAGLRVLETSHPPNYYFPPADVRAEALSVDQGSSWCEWKGRAHYYVVRSGDRAVPQAAWGYADPAPAYRALAGMIAFYPALMDECWVDDERASPQPGAFYGGWITKSVVGPFKGDAGSQSW